MLQTVIASSKVSIFENFESKQHAFIEFVLDQYIQHDVTELDDARISELVNLKYGTPQNAKQQLGPLTAIREMFCGFQKYLYEKDKKAGSL